jgi:hypothetical protein
MNLDAITGKEPFPAFPLIDEPTAKRMGAEWTRQFFETRADAIKRSVSNPLLYGHEPPIWLKADGKLAEFRQRFPQGVITELDIGGNRASKTERMAKRIVEYMRDNSGARVWACQLTETASIQNQQSVIYKYLPPEWKPDTGKLRHGVKTKIVYSQSGGFTENVLVCPNGSECRFKFYEMKVSNLEGAELDLVWADELVPPEWIEALIFRLVTRNGVLHITFTPTEGYTSTVKLHLGGATTIEEEEAELLPILGQRKISGGNDSTHKCKVPTVEKEPDEPGSPPENSLFEVIGYEKVPRVQENLHVEINGQKAKALIVYFHTKDNPFGNYEVMKATLEGANRDKILTRAYGVPTKAIMAKFPLFRDSVHVISLNRFREIQKGGGTWYHFLDSCSGRNWFQCWIFCDPFGRAFVAAESPSHDHDWAYIPGVGNPGPWAIPSNKLDGDAGDGQKEWGWGYQRYKEEIERMEALLSPAGESGKITISARWIDARYGNFRVITRERSTTQIEDLSALGLEFLAAPSEKFIDQGHGGGDGSLRMINNKLFYDADKPIDHTNQPHLYCVETCPNIIFSLKEWTGKDGQAGASKDPVDTLRMFVLSGVEYVDESLLQPKLPWMAQFSR